MLLICNLDSDKDSALHEKLLRETESNQSCMTKDQKMESDRTFGINAKPAGWW